MQRIWLLAIISFCSGQVAYAEIGSAHEITFPYEAVVVVPQAKIHGGPGEEYYATGRLALDTTVDVYRHAPGGWLAVRPPEGSFSWIFGRHVELAEDGLGRINKNEVPSRVGVEGNQQRNVIQIRLQEGEVVELLGQHEEAGQLWYKIAPPAGEFRWLHADNIGTLVPPVAAPVLNIGAKTDSTEGAEIEQSFQPSQLVSQQSTQQSAQQSAIHKVENPVQPATAWANVNAPVPNENKVVSSEPGTTRVGLPRASVVVVAHDELPMAVTESIPEVSAATKSGWLPREKTTKQPIDSPRRYAAPELFSQEQQATNGAVQAATVPAPEPATVAGQRWLPRRKSVRAKDRLVPESSPLSQGADSQMPYSQMPYPKVATAPATQQALPVEGREMSSEFTQAVVSIDVRLSQMVTTNRDTWQLGPLRQEAEELLRKSQTVAEREAGKHTLGKLDRFTAIQQGFAHVQRTPPPIAAIQPPVVAASPVPAVPYIAAPPRAEAIAPVEIPDFATAWRPGDRQPRDGAPGHLARLNRRRRYDAEGVLRTTSSRREGAPEYALLNRGGRVVALISATPDVDLEPFLGKRVGVAGERRFLPEYRKQHVTASRVLPLGAPLRR